MKRIFVLVVAVAAPYAHADCLDTWLTYRSSTLSLSVDYSKGCYEGELKINFSKPLKNELHWPSQKSNWNTVSFDRECGSSKVGKEGNVVEFSCRKDGESPLAGATYRYKVVKPKLRCEDGSVRLPDRSFICIHGCAPTVPRTLQVEYSEGDC